MRSLPRLRFGGPACGALCLGVALAAAIPAAAQRPATRPSMASLMPSARDYVLQYWRDGWRGRTADGRKLRVVQTGSYAMALDAERIAIPHLGPVRAPAPYARAGAEGLPGLAKLPPAALTLTLEVDGRTYRCTGAEPPSLHGGPRIVEAGRLLQRSDVTGLVFKDDGGARLPVEARLETIAWPDRLGLLLEAAPAAGDLTAGPGFGRVGGGWVFDGAGAIVDAAAPELDPAAFTVEMWAYLPDAPEATNAYPWLFCKGGNEWVDGAYGLALINGTPTARICIGGGRDNAFDLEARYENGGRLTVQRERWTHLAMTYDGGDLRIYVDGRPAGSMPVNRARKPRPDGIALGRRLDDSGDGYHFRGALDEVRLTGRALAAAEIARRFAKPEAAEPDAAEVRAWLFDPKGPAMERRPVRSWRGASMRLELRTGGRAHVARLAPEPGREWRTGERRSVAVALDPATGAPAAEEQVQVAASERTSGRLLPVTADPIRGWVRVNLDDLQAQGSGNDLLDRARLTLTNPTDRALPLRLLLEKTDRGLQAPGMSQVTGISPMLRDADGNPTGLHVQLSKNWHSQPGRDLVYQGAWLHAAAYLRLPPHATVDLEATLAYARWGGVPAASHAQLCLIGWGSNQEWNQSAIGAWGESICYEPDQAQAECLICDVRPLLVASRFAGKPVRWTWTGNVGGGDLVRWFDARGKRRFPDRMNTVVRRIGPNLTEVTYAGGFGQGAIRHSVTVSLHRTDDLVRGVYRLSMRVLRPVEFSRLVLFQIGADTYSYTGERRMAVGNASGLAREWETRWGGDTYRTRPVPLKGPAAWVAMQGCAPRSDGADWLALANRGLVVRSWKARLGGRPAEPWFAEHGARVGGADTSTADILPPPGVARLLPGDGVEAVFEHVIVPQRAEDYYGPNAAFRAALERDQDTWRIIRREAAGNALTAKATVGRIASAWPLKVAAIGDRARFSVTGGLGYVPITFTGLTGFRDPVLEVREPGGPWKRVDQTLHGKDYWQADFDAEARTWEITYTIPLDTPGDAPTPREMRFRLGP
ncbi:MAG: LamG domain-containing protein [Armatimonadetes bacterium]|nr:LamG domain-containing protein [Armatimonadota bacterium]